MRDINYSVRKAYYQVLNGSLTYKSAPVPVYDKQIPVADGIDPNPTVYVLIESQYNADVSSKSSFDNNHNIQITIISKALKNNSGRANDEVGGQILQLVYPTRVGSPLQVDGCQVINTLVLSDNVFDGFTDGVEKTVQRVIVFQHLITQIN